MRPLLRKLARNVASPPRPRVQILSDLHLEISQQYQSYTFPATAPLLLLAGDVGRLADYDNYKAFLETQAPRYDKVLLVLGNHEFYELGYEAGVDAARRLAAEPSLADRLVLLHALVGHPRGRVPQDRARHQRLSPD